MTTHYAMVRGSVVRFTLLNRRGTPVEGPRSTIVTKGIASVDIDEVSENQSSDLMRADYADEPRVMLRGRERTVRFDTTITLTNVDPDLIEMLTGHPVVLNAAGDVVGNDANTRLPVSNFAMEVWSKLAGRGAGGYGFGYTLFPRLRGGRLDGFAFANGRVTMRIVGARTTRMSNWGVGPYMLSGNLVVNSEAPYRLGACIEGSPSADSPRLVKPVSNNSHWMTFLLNEAPLPTDGAVGLYDAILGGTAASTTSDVIAGGTAAVTTPDTIYGGTAA